MRLHRVDDLLSARNGEARNVNIYILYKLDDVCGVVRRRPEAAAVVVRRGDAFKSLPTGSFGHKMMMGTAVLAPHANCIVSDTDARMTRDVAAGVGLVVGEQLELAQAALVRLGLGGDRDVERDVEGADELQERVFAALRASLAHEELPALDADVHALLPTMTWAQIALFAIFALALLSALARAHGFPHRVELVGHVVLNAAMIWMLAAMPLLMAGMDMGGDGGSAGGLGGVGGMLGGGNGGGDGGG
mgnify:CR=1 FL=1